MSELYLAPLLALIVSWLVVWSILRKPERWVQDLPNARSLHKTPVPRLGGVGVMAGLAVAGWWLDGLGYWFLWLPVLGLFVISMLDDVLNLSAKLRLLVHLLLAAVFLLGLSLPWWAWPLLLLLVGWQTNLYNFMDGSDGLAGGMALFGFATLALAAALAGDVFFALLNLSVATAALGFLVFNFHPARIFMGDSASIPLGFLSVAFSLWGWQQHYWPFWFGLLVFSPFVVDATVTLIKRALRGENLAIAHRSHYYQRLVQLGWGHRHTALVEYSLMMLVGMSALLALSWSWAAQLVLLAGWALIYGGLMWKIDVCWRQQQKDRAC